MPKVTLTIPNFYVSKDGALVVEDPENCDDFGEIMRVYGMAPQHLSKTYRAALGIIASCDEEFAKLVANCTTDGYDEVVRRFMEAHDALGDEQAKVVTAATSMTEEFLSVARTNFLAGLRFGVALRDNTLGAVNTDGMESRFKGMGGENDEPAASVGKGEAH